MEDLQQESMLNTQQQGSSTVYDMKIFHLADDFIQSNVCVHFTHGWSRESNPLSWCCKHNALEDHLMAYFMLISFHSILHANIFTCYFPSNKQAKQTAKVVELWTWLIYLKVTLYIKLLRITM
jgi:hypothetical protein